MLPGAMPSVYHFVANARRRVDITMYELADPHMEHLLAADASRHVAVKVILQGGYVQYENQPAFDYLRSHGVSVIWASGRFDLTHQKTITVDAEAAIMTGNLTARCYPTTRDFIVYDSAPADVRAIVAVFDADFARLAVGEPRGSGDLVWSPGQSASVIPALISSARRSLQLENEEMSDPAVINALCQAARRGVHVELTMTYDSEWAGAFDRLAAAGVKVHVDYGERPIYIHAKAIVVDDRTAFVGSENFSVASLGYNRELGIVLAGRSQVRYLAGMLTSDFSHARPWTAN